MQNARDYELLDSGDGRRLERFGEHVLDRPSPAAIWPKTRDAGEWTRAVGFYERSSSGGGAWREPHGMPETWCVSLEPLTMRLKPTGFGHLGVFPEQWENWTRLARRVEHHRQTHGEAPEVLNLFAYTGGSTLACASAGASVCHVDSARGIVGWARENAELSQVPEDRVRWIVEDARKFVEREIRRGREYDGIVLDPPSYGRGKKGAVWQLERDLAELTTSCCRLLSARASFVLLSAHTPGVGPAALANLLTLGFRAAAREDLLVEATLSPGEMLVQPVRGGVPLPCGEQVWWTRGAE